MRDCDLTIPSLLEDPSPATLTQHLQHCASCQRLARVDRAFAVDVVREVVPGVALRAAIERDVAPVHHRSAWARASLPLGAMVAVGVSGLTLLGRPPVASAPVWEAAALAFAMALGGIALGFHRGALGLGVPVWWRRVWLVGAAGVFLLALVARGMAPGPAKSRGGTFAHMGTSAINAVADPHHHAVGPLQAFGACASTTSMFVGVVALAALWAARRTVPVSSGSMGAVFGAAAGLSALAAVSPTCTGDALHTLTAHGGPGLMATVLCLFLGRRALAP